MQCDEVIWQVINQQFCSFKAKLTDKDLNAIATYFKSLPAVRNKVTRK